MSFAPSCSAEHFTVIYLIYMIDLFKYPSSRLNELIGVLEFENWSFEVISN